MAWFEHDTSRIYFEDEGSGNETVLFLPGLTDSISMHEPLRQAVTGAGYRVIAADLPGSGRSQPQPRVYTATYFQEDASALAALLSNQGIERAHLIGFSDGGEVALVMAELSPAIARSVVTWGSAGQLKDDGGQLRAMFDSIIDNPAPPLQDFSQYLIATYGKDVARATTQNAVRAMTEIIETRGGDLSLSRAGEIKCPVLLVAGEHDPFAPAALLTEFVARLPQGRMVEVKDAGHDVHHSHGQWLIAAVLDWLKQPGGTSGG